MSKQVPWEEEMYSFFSNSCSLKLVPDEWLMQGDIICPIVYIYFNVSQIRSPFRPLLVGIFIKIIFIGNNLQ